MEIIVIAVLVILLLIAGYLYSQEQSMSSLPIPDVPKASLEPVLPNDNTKAVEAAFAGEKDIKRSPYMRLIRYNIFQIVSRQDRQALERQAMTDLVEAQRLLREGKRDEALRQCEKILESVPNHPKTHELMAQIQAAMKPVNP